MKHSLIFIALIVTVFSCLSNAFAADFDNNLSTPASNNKIQNCDTDKEIANQVIAFKTSGGLYFR